MSVFFGTRDKSADLEVVRACMDRASSDERDAIIASLPLYVSDRTAHPAPRRREAESRHVVEFVSFDDRTLVADASDNSVMFSASPIIRDLRSVATGFRLHVRTSATIETIRTFLLFAENMHKPSMTLSEALRVFHFSGFLNAEGVGQSLAMRIMDTLRYNEDNQRAWSMKDNPLSTVERTWPQVIPRQLTTPAGCPVDFLDNYRDVVHTYTRLRGEVLHVTHGAAILVLGVQRPHTITLLKTFCGDDARVTASVYTGNNLMACIVRKRSLEYRDMFGNFTSPKHALRQLGRTDGIISSESDYTRQQLLSIACHVAQGVTAVLVYEEDDDGFESSARVEFVRLTKGEITRIRSVRLAGEDISGSAGACSFIGDTLYVSCVLRDGGETISSIHLWTFQQTAFYGSARRVPRCSSVFATAGFVAFINWQAQGVAGERSISVLVVGQSHRVLLDLSAAAPFDDAAYDLACVRTLTQDVAVGIAEGPRGMYSYWYLTAHDGTFPSRCVSAPGLVAGSEIWCSGDGLMITTSATTVSARMVGSEDDFATAGRGV